MDTTVIDVTGRPPLAHTQAMGLQASELARTVELLASLEPADWSAATDCPDWDVHQLYLHVLGACEAAASMRENVHQLRAAWKHRSVHGGPLEAALSHVQVAERGDVSPDRIVARLREIAPAAVRGRTRMPALARRARIKVDGPVVETWTLGYLIDTIYLRDLWMHRVDATIATGREHRLTADHDGVVVADLVTEWARRHGQPFDLTLNGPAGGRFRSRGANPADGGDSTDPIELDAVEFCRVLAGRLPPPHPLLETIVPF